MLSSNTTPPTKEKLTGKNSITPIDDAPRLTLNASQKVTIGMFLLNLHFVFVFYYKDSTIGFKGRTSITDTTQCSFCR
jgi:hypothetical protein